MLHFEIFSKTKEVDFEAKIIYNIVSREKSQIAIE
jgi:hypothetical protein